MSSKGSKLRGTFSDLNVGTKIGLLLLAMVIVAAVNVVLVYQATQANEQIGNQVDVAGSNEMWSQRVAFISFMIKDGHPDGPLLQESMQHIDENLAAMDEGGTVDEKRIEPVPQKAQDELRDVQSEWTRFRNATQTIVEKEPYNPEFEEAKNYIKNNNDELLKESNDVVVAYTQHPNSGQYSDEINVAGRQRMLSQRIAKLSMTISSESIIQGGEAREIMDNQESDKLQSHREELRAYVDEYDSALDALENGGTHKGTALQPAPPSVRQEIQDLRGVWTPFKENALITADQFRLNPGFWAGLAYVEENVDKFVQDNEELTSTLATISSQRSQSLRQMLIGLLGVDIIVFLAGVVVVRRTVSSPLNRMTTEAQRIADQDLRDRDIRGADRGDEIGGLSTSFRDMLDNLRRIMTSIKGDSATVASSAEELAAANEETNAASEEIASMVQNINDAAQSQAAKANDASLKLQNLSDRSDQIADNAETAEEISSEAREKAERGGEAAEEAMETMDGIREAATESAEDVKDLGEKSEEIGQIVDMITEIAEQTNLLALNAAIEAARAGEQGKGFAVVAEEIRSLAEESTEAAEQISDLIADIRDQTDSAVDSMEEGTTRVKKGTEVVEEALAALEEITGAVEETSEKVKDISGAAQEQTDMVEDAVSSIDEISRMAQETADNTEDVSAATEEQTASLQQVSTSAEELSDIAENLQAVVDEFRLEDEQ